MNRYDIGCNDLRDFSLFYTKIVAVGSEVLSAIIHQIIRCVHMKQLGDFFEQLSS